MFWPFVAGCKPIFVSALAVGEASTAVVAAAIALVQGQARAAAAADGAGDPGGNDNGLLFGPSVYFGVLAVIMGLTGVSYVLVTALPEEVRCGSLLDLPCRACARINCSCSAFS